MNKSNFIAYVLATCLSGLLLGLAKMSRSLKNNWLMNTNVMSNFSTTDPGKRFQYSTYICNVICARKHILSVLCFRSVLCRSKNYFKELVLMLKQRNF